METIERRKIVQEPIFDEDGRIEYYKIPNYTLRNEFITSSERDFFRFLINIVKKLNEEYKSKNIKKYLQISTQVAINRIIDINNQRNSDLYEEIKNKSIDYVLFDLNTGKIECCIELNGKEHLEDEKRKNRDILVYKMFNGLIKYIPIERKEEYDENEIMLKIKE